MLDRIFDFEGPVAQFIFRVKDLIVLNILTIVCCLPIFSVGPALKALAFTTLKMVRDEDGNVISTYFKNFKLNFKQTVGFGIVCLILMLICAGDVYAVIAFKGSFPPVMILFSVLVILVVLAVLVYAVPMQGRFLNPIAVTFKNAFWAAISGPVRTILMAGSWLVLPAFDLFVSRNFLPLIFFFGLSLPAFLNAKLYEPLFRQMENKILGRSGEDEDPENPEAAEEPENPENPGKPEDPDTP